MSESRPEGKIEISLDTWAESKPTPIDLSQKDIDEIHALLDKVGEKCSELGTSFFCSFVTKLNGIGSGTLQSRVGVTKGTLTPEVWCGQFLAVGGLDNLLDNLGDLIDSANARLENCKTLSLILPSTSIIV